MVEIRAKQAPALNKRNPLLQYTLQGQAAKLDEMAVAQQPLLGSFCLTGQGTVICAPPGAGKTLITLAMLTEAISIGRITGDDVYYVDADDTTQGVADKVRLLDEYGVHVIAEGFNGFKASMLTGALEDMIQDSTARGKFLILDTFKKFTQPMSKVDTSRFTEVVRRFILAGGTLLCLSHTNKNTDSQGRNVFAGVSDIIDDLDCAYVIDVIAGKSGTKLARFSNKKRRGNVPDSIAYGYSPEPEISYLERLTSVQEVDDYKSEDDPEDHDAKDDDILDAIALTIFHRAGCGKMEIIRSVAKSEATSKRRVLMLLDRHTGDDPLVHRWRYLIGARGIHKFELLKPLGELLQAPASSAT